MAVAARDRVTGEAAAGRRRLEPAGAREGSCPLWLYTRPQPSIWMPHVHIDLAPSSHGKLLLRDLLRLLRHSDELPALAEKLKVCHGGRSADSVAAGWTDRLSILKAHHRLIERCAAVVDVSDASSLYWLDSSPSAALPTDDDADDAADRDGDAGQKRDDLWHILHRVDAALEALGMTPLLPAGVREDSSSPLLPSGDAERAVFDAPPPVRLADPCNLAASFYHTRREAISGHSYTNLSSLVVIGIDKANGSQAKLFNAVEALEVARFVQSIPQCQDRNCYVLVDEVRPVDPFFDIDVDASYLQAAFPAAKERIEEACEVFLADVLGFLSRAVCQFFNTTIESTVVLTSSVLQRHVAPSTDPATADAVESWKGKISFHIHFRMSEGRCFANVATHKMFIETIEDASIPWRTSSASGGAGGAGENQDSSRMGLPDDLSRKALVLRSIDAGVYTKWRPLRLPWCTKRHARLAEAASGVLVDDDDNGQPRMITALAHEADDHHSTVFGQAAGSAVKCVQCAARAFAHSGDEKRRYLQPIIIGATHVATPALLGLLQECSCMALPPSQTSLATGASSIRQQDDVISKIVRLALIQRFDDEHVVPHGNEAFGESAPGADSTSMLVPFGCGARRYVHGALQAALAEVFRCLHHKYRELEATSITSTSITAQFEDNGISRSYYVFQKRNKFCVALEREHKSTFGQLYVTYGSIKYRCYSNDCCRKCLKLPWTLPKGNELGEVAAGADAVSPHVFKWRDGSEPVFERLKELRDVLFPALDQDELSRRYGLLSSLSASSAGSIATGETTAQ